MICSQQAKGPRGRLAGFGKQCKTANRQKRVQLYLTAVILNSGSWACLAALGPVLGTQGLQGVVAFVLSHDYERRRAMVILSRGAVIVQHSQGMLGLDKEVIGEACR
jgi:hypothetical protein